MSHPQDFGFNVNDRPMRVVEVNKGWLFLDVEEDYESEFFDSACAAQQAAMAYKPEQLSEEEESRRLSIMWRESMFESARGK